jgi:hypothetical protein
MSLAVYYLLFGFGVLMCWPHTFGTKGWRRLPWLILGIAILGLPLLAPLKTAFYFGLLGNASMWAWASDSHTGREDRRWRGVMAGIALSLAPFVSRGVLERWGSLLLVSGLGFLVLAGVFTRLAITLAAVGRGVRMAARRQDS